MAMRWEKVTRRSAIYSSVCHLMRNAFPKNELVPLWVLVMQTFRKDVQYRAFFDDDQFCGILYTVEDKSHIFVLYLAVNDEIRSKGYGSKILEWLKSSSSKAVVLHVEPLDPKAENALQREKRIAFYQRNGILDTGYLTTVRNEDFAVLSSDREHFDAKEHLSLLKRFSFGLFYQKAIPAK